MRTPTTSEEAWEDYEAARRASWEAYDAVLVAETARAAAVEAATNALETWGALKDDKEHHEDT